MSATNEILINDNEQELNLSNKELNDLINDPLTILEAEEYDKNNGVCPKEFING